MKSFTTIAASAVLGVWMFIFPWTATTLAVTYKAAILPMPSGSGGTIALDIHGSSIAGGSNTHALFWPGATTNPIDLHLAEFNQSAAEGAWNNSQVGFGRYGEPSFGYHALMWNGTAQSVVDLHPTGPTFSTRPNSRAYAMWGNVQVGEAWPDYDRTHAVMWSGTAASAIDLHPTGFRNSTAWDVYEGFQVGYGRAPGGGSIHAILWNGTAASALDLNPPGFEHSYAYGVWENTQVGFGSLPTGEVALLWHGTADSYVNLNPVGFADSRVHGISGNIQVGVGNGPATNNKPHALVWFGTAESAIDLHQFLGNLPITLLESTAYEVNSDGTIVGYGWTGGQQIAVVWTPVPEPSTLGLLGGGLLGVVTLQRRRKVCRSGAGSGFVPIGRGRAIS